MRKLKTLTDFQRNSRRIQRGERMGEEGAVPGEHAERSERHLWLWALTESRCGRGRGLLSLQPSPKATKLYPKPQKGWERKEVQASPAAITK